MATAAYIPVELDTSGIPAQFQRAIDQAQRAARPINLRVNAQPLGRITGDIQEFTKSLEASNARVIAFGATTGIIYGLGRAFSSLVSATAEVEQAMARINAVSSATSSSMAKLEKSVFDIARSTSSSFKDIAEAAEEFVRQGSNITEALSRTEAAAKLSRLTFINIKDAVQDLTAAMNNFGREALSADQITNKLASLGTNFAVSQKDLADAITRAGAAAAGANVSFDQFLGLITSVKQSTSRAGSTIGEAFRTIFTRLDRGGTVDALKNIGVQARDVAGNMRPTVDVLRELAGVYQTLGESQKEQIAEQIGGVRQIQSLKALLSDLARQYSVVDQATRAAANATNEANTRLAIINNTIENLTSQAGTNIKELFSSIGKVSIEPVIKGLLQNFNNIFDSSNGGGGGFGEQLGQGLLKGIASTIQGPGAVLLIAIFANLFKKVTEFGIKSVADLAGLNKNSKEQAETQGQINALLQTGNSYYITRYNSARTVQEQEQAILNLIRIQNAELQRQSSRGAAVTPGIQSQGSFSPSRSFTPSAEGLIPTVNQENNSIRNGVGGASPDSKAVVIPNFNGGGVVANTSEYLVTNFKGSGKDAIFNQKMLSSIGGPSNLKHYGNSKKLSAVANGLIPNFVNKYAKNELDYNGLLIDKNYKYIYDDSTEISESRRLAARQSGFEILSKGDAQYINNNSDILKGHKLNVVDPFAGIRDDFGNSNFNILDAKSFYGDKLKEANASKFLPRSVALTDFVKKNKIGRNNLDKFFEKADKEFGKNFFLKLRSGAQGEGVFSRDVAQAQLFNLPNAKDYFLQEGIHNISDKEYRVSVAGVKNKAQLLGGALLRSQNGRLSHEFINEKIKPNLNIFSKSGLDNVLGRYIAEKQGKRAFNALPDAYKSGTIAGLDVLETGNRGIKRAGQALAEFLGFGRFVKGGGVAEFNFSQNAESVGESGQAGSAGSLKRLDILTSASKALLKNGGNFFAKGFIPNYHDPLQDAIHREARAVGADKVYIDKDSRLKNNSNPLGLLVANRRDEPFGGSQGVNRALKEGRNPHTYGVAAEGIVPNFAPPVPLSSLSAADQTRTNDIIAALQEAARAARDAALAQQRAGRTNEILSKANAGESLTTKDRGHLYSDFRRQNAQQFGLDFNDVSFLRRSNEGQQAVSQFIDSPASAGVIQTNRLQQSKALELEISDYLGAQQRKSALTGVGLQSGFDKLVGNRSLTKAQLDNSKDQIADILSQRRQRRNQALFGASFALPIVTQLGASLAGQDPNSQGGRVASGLSQAVGTGATIASLLPNGTGVAIGAAATALIGLRTITSNVGTTLEDFSKKLEENSSKMAEQNTAISTTINSFEALQGIVREGGSSASISRAVNNVTQNFSQVRGANRGDFINAFLSGNTEKLRDVQAKQTFDSNREIKTNQFAEALGAQNEKAGATDNPLLNVLLPSRRSLQSAFDKNTPDDFFKKATRGIYDLFSSQQTSQGLQYHDLSKSGLEQVQNQLSLVPFDVNKINLQQAQTQRSNGVDPRNILGSLFTQSGIKNTALQEAIQGSSFNNGGQELDETLKRLTQEKTESEQIAKKGDVVKNAGKLVQVSSDILQNLGIALDSRNIQREAVLSQAQARGAAYLNQNSGSLSDVGKVQANYTLESSKIQNSSITDVNNIITNALKKLELPQDKLDQPDIARGIAETVRDIIRDPNQIVNKVGGIGDILEKGGATDQEVKKFRDAGIEITRALTQATNKTQIDKSNAYLNSQLEIQGITRQRQREFLGGNFTQLSNPNFTAATQGFAAFRAQGQIGTPLFIGGRRDPVAEQHRDNSLLTNQAEGLLQLDKLGILPKQGEQRDKYREIITKAIQGNMNAALDQLSQSATPEFASLINAARGNVAGAAKVQAEDLLPGAADKSISTISGYLNGVAAPAQNDVNSITKENIDRNADNIAALNSTTAQLNNLQKAVDPLTTSIKELSALMAKALGQETPKTEDTPGKASGWVPNFNAYSKELKDISNGVGGARIGDRPFSTNISGLGPAVVNTGESIIRNFLGSGNDAVFNRKMAKSFGGSLSSLGKVENKAGGFVPNFTSDQDDYDLYSVHSPNISAAEARERILHSDDDNYAIEGRIANEDLDEIVKIYKKQGIAGVKKAISNPNTQGQLASKAGGFVPNFADTGYNDFNALYQLATDPFRSALAIKDIIHTGSQLIQGGKDRSALGGRLVARSSKHIDASEISQRAANLGLDWNRLQPEQRESLRIAFRKSPEDFRTTTTSIYPTYKSGISSRATTPTNPLGNPRNRSEVLRANNLLDSLRDSPQSSAQDAYARSRGYRSDEDMQNFIQTGELNSGKNVYSPDETLAGTTYQSIGVSGKYGTLINTIRHGKDSFISSNHDIFTDYGTKLFDEKNSPNTGSSSVSGYGTTIFDEKNSARGFIPNFSALDSGPYGATNIHHKIRGLPRHVGPLTQIQRMIANGNLQEARDAINAGGLPSSFYSLGLDSNNLTGVKQAIEREQKALIGRGIPTNLARGAVFVGNHALAGGWAVGNYYDEPAGRHNTTAGIMQGIERVKSSGGNPRTAGTPNYAAPRGGTNDISSSIQELSAAIKELLASKKSEANSNDSSSGGGVKVDHSISVNASINGTIASANSQVQELVTSKLAELQAQIQALQLSQKDNKNYTPQPPSSSTTSASTAKNGFSV